VEVAEIFVSLRGSNDCEMNVEVSIRLLCISDHFYELMDCVLDLPILMLVEKVTSALDPFGNIAIPKEVVWDRPMIWLVVVARVVLQLECIVSTGGFEDVKL
jgi:hypothetical protein